MGAPGGGVAGHEEGYCSEVVGGWERVVVFMFVAEVREDGDYAALVILGCIEGEDEVDD